MYDQLFSPQWIFDRCFELSRIVGILTPLISVALSIILYFILKRPQKPILQAMRAGFLTLLIPPYILGLIFTSPQLVRFLSNELIFVAINILWIGLFIFSANILRKVSFSKNKIKAISAIILNSIGAIPLAVSSIIITGFFIVGCSYNPFWDGLTPAHKLHAQVKNQTYQLGYPPRSELELEELNPNLYNQIVKNAKTKYIYDQESNTYTWFVRPSRYIVAVFNSANDYQLFNLNSGLVQQYLPSNAPWPPNYIGPWDQLPN